MRSAKAQLHGGEGAIDGEPLKGRPATFPRPKHLRPLVDASKRVAARFDGIMRAHAEAGDPAATNPAAGRRCGVSEMHVRRWRADERPFPLAAVELMSPTIADEILVATREAIRQPATPERTVESHARQLSSFVGALSAEVDKALEDGVIDEEEKRRIALRLHAFRRQAERAIADLERGGR